jgi:hypothetical protein
MTRFRKAWRFRGGVARSLDLEKVALREAIGSSIASKQWLNNLCLPLLP